jgi:predicted nucleotidyltransferase
MQPNVSNMPRSLAVLPIEYRHDLLRAVEILKAAGCTDLFVFGSLARGRISAQSDIDLAIRGCPKGHFFSLLGRLTLELDHPVDLINLDTADSFARYLEREKGLLQIA